MLRSTRCVLGGHSLETLDNGEHVTTFTKKLLLTGLDLSGLFVAWAMFGTRYLPYFVIALLALYLLPLLQRRRG